MRSACSRTTFLRLDRLIRTRTMCPIVFMIVYNCAIFAWMSINFDRAIAACVKLLHNGRGHS